MAVFDNAYTLIVGIAQYKRIRPLPDGVTNDADTIRKALIDPNVCAYDPKQTPPPLLDGKATKDAIKSALNELQKKCNDDSTVFIYFSGHGGRLESGDHQGNYLLPVDTVYPDEAALAQSAISADDFNQALRNIPSRKMIVVLDCCHAGGTAEAKELTSEEAKYMVGPTFKSGLTERYLDQLGSGFGRVVFASSRTDELSHIFGGETHSLFTKHFLAGLKGSVPSPDGFIRVFDLFHYLQPKVTAEEPKQHPVFKCEVEENFPISLCLGGKSVAAATPITADEYKYDVFLSYRDASKEDKAWALTVLLPRLQEKRLKVCIDVKDFRLGRPIIEEVERVVQESRYTLSVITQEYLDSNLAEYGSVLSKHLGLETSQTRWIGVLREKCKLGLDYRSRMLLDMTEDEQLDANITRLAFELKQPTDP